MRIAVIGGIGSGKSEVLAVAREMGVCCLSADEINRELLADEGYASALAARLRKYTLHNTGTDAPVPPDISALREMPYMSSDTFLSFASDMEEPLSSGKNISTTFFSTMPHLSLSASFIAVSGCLNSSREYSL